MVYFITLVLLVSVCAVLHHRRAAPYKLFAVATGLAILSGLVIVVIGRTYPEAIFGFSFARTAEDIAGVALSTDTYTVFWAPLWQLLGTIAIPVAATMILWAQERLGAMYYPALTRWLFWPIIAGAVLVPGIMTLLLVNALWSPADPGLSVRISTAMGWIAAAALAALAALSLWSFIRHMRARD